MKTESTILKTKDVNKSYFTLVKEAVLHFKSPENNYKYYTIDKNRLYTVTTVLASSVINEFSYLQGLVFTVSRVRSYVSEEAERENTEGVMCFFEESMDPTTGKYNKGCIDVEFKDYEIPFTYTYTLTLSKLTSPEVVLQVVYEDINRDINDTTQEIEIVEDFFSEILNMILKGS